MALNRLVSVTPLHFDASFGEGQDRHVSVRAASAVLRLGSRLIIAQDDSNFAAVVDGAHVTPLRLFADEGADTFSAARGNKALKPDLELGAVFELAGREAAVFFGSGSTPRRTRAAWVVERPGALEVHGAALDSLYAAARARLSLSAEALNLEAAAATGAGVTFFQRGNGPGGLNATFAVTSKTLEHALLEGAPIRPDELHDVRTHALGALGAAPLGFSAATPLPDGRVLFLAAAEASPSTFDDGVVTGTVVGVMDTEGRLSRLEPVPHGPRGPLKLEGVALEGLEHGEATLYAVDDADDPAQASNLVVLRVVLP